MAVAEDDLRSQLVAAFAADKETQEPPEPIEKIEAPPPELKAEAKVDPTRPRDDRGRFVSGVEKAPEQAQVPAAPDPAKLEAPIEQKAEGKPAVSAAPAPPNGWAAEAKAKWHELPPEIQAAVSKRETDIAKFTGKTDEERAFGREMQRVVQPYLATIQAEGGTPITAVQSLLNTAYVLRSGTPQQKQQALLGVAQQYGIDLSNAPARTQVAPEIAQLQQEISGLRQQLTQRESQTQAQTQAEIQSDIEAFAADPKHPHFQEVKAHMAALLGNGVAKDLQDAYDQACWARPDIRATLSAQQRAEEEQKRRSEEKAKAEAAKRKGASITGGPGSAASAAPGDRSLRDELLANFRAGSGLV